MAKEPTQQDNSAQVGAAILKTLQDIVVAINGWTQALLSVWPRTTGSFTLAAAATTTVSQQNIKSTSVIMLTATNATAATLMGSAKALYIVSRTPGTGFVVGTASAAAAAGTETFDYAIFSPS
jgi:hypothetical protein